MAQDSNQDAFYAADRPYFEFGYTPEAVFPPPPVSTHGLQPNYFPPVTPLPLRQALRELPRQYYRVMTKPAAASYIPEIGKAAWNVVGVQLLIIALIGAVVIFLIGLLFSFLFLQIAPPDFLHITGIDFTTLQLVSFIVAMFTALFIPISFFIQVGILHILAKAFGGQGTLLAQSYTRLLFTVPTTILIYLLYLIPVLGWFFASILAFYAIMQAIYSIMAVYRLSGIKAAAVVLIPYVALFLAQGTLSYFLTTTIQHLH